MNSAKTALKSLIEALEYHTEQTRPIQKTSEAIELGKSALAEIEKREPVAWQRYSEEMIRWVDLQKEDIAHYKSKGQSIRELYTSPISKEWVGLTESEISDLSREMVKSDKSVNWLAIRLETKLKSLNSPPDKE